MTLKLIDVVLKSNPSEVDFSGVPKASETSSMIKIKLSHPKNSLKRSSKPKKHEKRWLRLRRGPFSVLGMIWMYGETKDLQRIADHAEGTFWYVIPSLPMFLLMPWMIRKGISFPAALSAGIVLTGILYFIMTKALAKFGMNL